MSTTILREFITLSVKENLTKEHNDIRACYNVKVSHTEPCDTNEGQSAEMKNIFFNFNRLAFTINGNRNFRVYITVVAQMQRRIFCFFCLPPKTTLRSPTPSPVSY